MKYLNKIKSMIAIILLSIIMSSCATIFGGPVSTYQKTQPLPGEPQRDVRLEFLILDVLFLPALIIDFATGAIYKPKINKEAK